MFGRVEREQKGTMRPGQDLVAAGFAGLAGAQLLTRFQREPLERWFQQDYLDELLRQPLLHLPETAEYWNRFGITEWEQVGEGGIFAALWNLSGAYQTGFLVSLQDIPVRQAAIEVCERLELNPYRLYSAGMYLLCAENGGQAVRALMQEGIFAAVIGTVRDGSAREIQNGEGRGFLERPQPDELKKIIPDYIF